jgi:signal peptidase I
MPTASRSTRLRRAWRDHRGTAAFLLLMLTFRSAWADWMQVPTGSMNPTIIEGDRILVDKHAFGLRVPFTLARLTHGDSPRRGEIVVFDSPADGTTLVKRVVAEPGDTVELRGERLIVNGEPSVYAPGDPARLDALLSTTAAIGPQVWRERGALPAHDILLLPRVDAMRSFGPLTVPAGSYFMMGDNRDNSADSRTFGFVPRGLIYGRATKVVASFNPEHLHLPRADRWWRPLS